MGGIGTRLWGLISRGGCLSEGHTIHDHHGHYEDSVSPYFVLGAKSAANKRPISIASLDNDDDGLVKLQMASAVIDEEDIRVNYLGKSGKVVSCSVYSSSVS